MLASKLGGLHIKVLCNGVFKHEVKTDGAQSE